MVRDFIIATYENRDRAYEAARDGAIVEKDMLGIVTQADSKELASPWGTVGGVAPGISRARRGPGYGAHATTHAGGLR